MVHDDVLRIIQVAGKRHHVGPSEFVCTIDGFVFPVRPEDSILEIRQKYGSFLLGGGGWW